MFYLDKENNGVNDNGKTTLFPNSTRLYGNLCFPLLEKCFDFIRGFIFHLENVPLHKIPPINLKFRKLNQFSNIPYDLESINEHLIVCLTL